MKSTFSLSFFLKRTAVRKTGEMPVIGRITVNGKAVEFRPGLSVRREDWSVEKGRAIGRTPDVIRLNAMLDAARNAVTQHYQRLLTEDGYVTAEKVRDAYLGRDEKALKKKEEERRNNTTLLDFFDRFNREYRLKVEAGTTTQKTYSRYILTRNRLLAFMREKYGVTDICLKKVDLFFIENFYLYLRKVCECTNNTSMKFIQRFGKVVSVARDMGIVKSDPFVKFDFHFDEVDRGYLTQEELDRIETKEFVSERLRQVRDIFVFSCYTGLSYIDIANLKGENVQTSFDGHEWIKIRRQKTQVVSSVRLLEIPKAILAKYKGKQPDGKLLPVISNQKMNEYLNEIATLCNIDKHITFHLARHTFATTVTLSQGVPIETVSKMLGHNSIRTTQIYARIIEQKISEDMALLEQKMQAKRKRGLHL